MRIRFTIDGSSYSFNLNSDKPLKDILEETLASFPINNGCLSGNCGNCIVIMNGELVLSCLVPACRLNGVEIRTFEGFIKTRGYHDIERAYSETGTRPCPHCIASKTLLIESILNKMSDRNFKLTRSFVAREIGINGCNCIETVQIERIIKLADQFRRKRLAGRS